MAAAPVSAARPEANFITDEDAMMWNLAGGSVEPILTVGDEIGSYLFDALPDGISVTSWGSNSVKVFINHETSTVPFPYSTSSPVGNLNDFTDSLVNPCTGETIGFSGTMTTTSNVQDNGFRTNFRFTTDVKGRGVVIADAFGQPVTNGTEYKVQTRVKSVNDQLDPVVYPFTQSQEVDMKLVGAGGENNFFFRFNARLVINAQGDLTVFKENSDLRCESVPAFTKQIILYLPPPISPDIYYQY
jgi:hypothetical protein